MSPTSLLSYALACFLPPVSRLDVLRQLPVGPPWSSVSTGLGGRGAAPGRLSGRYPWGGTSSDPERPAAPGPSYADADAAVGG